MALSPAATPTSKTVRFGLGALAALVPFTAAGQQVASTQQQALDARLAAACNHLQNRPAEHAGCLTRETILFDQAREAAAQKRIDGANVEITCQETLMKGITGGTFKREEVLGAYAGRPVGSVSACVILGALRKS